MVIVSSYNMHESQKPLDLTYEELLRFLTTPVIEDAVGYMCLVGLTWGPQPL